MPSPIATRPHPHRVIGGGTRACAAVRALASRSVPVLVFTVAALAATETGAATIHACPTPSGTTVFQDRPCERRTPEVGATSTTPRRTPAGLHESWFDRPDGADVVARCDDDGCRCDALARPFDSGLELAVADALYLDGAWHRLEEAIAARRDGAPDAPPPATLDRLVDEAACDVLISQRILRAHAPDVLSALRSRARETEERGYDDGVDCAAGDTIACEHVDGLQLYRRMVADLVALRSPRDGATLPDTGPDALSNEGIFRTR